MPYLQDFLKKQFSEYLDREVKANHEIPSQNDFAKYVARAASEKLGREIIISPTTWSQWATGNRPPTREHMRWLSAYFGPIIYDILGEPPEMPADPIIRGIVDTAIRLDRPRKQIAARLIKALDKGNFTDELKKIMEEAAKKPQTDDGVEGEQVPAK